MVQNKIIELLGLLERDFEFSEWTQKLDLEKTHNFFLMEVEELKDALKNKDMENYGEELGDILWLVLKMMKVAEREGILDSKRVVENIKNKINLRKPFLAEKRFVSSQEEVELWNKAKDKKNESTGNHR